MPSAWYEVLSVLHTMAMLRLSRANYLLLPKTSIEGFHAKVSEGLYHHKFHSSLLQNQHKSLLNVSVLHLYLLSIAVSQLLCLIYTFQRTNELLLKYFSRQLGTWSVLFNTFFLGYRLKKGGFLALSLATSLMSRFQFVVSAGVIVLDCHFV